MRLKMNTEKILTALYESYTNLGFVLTEGRATAAAAGAALYNQRTKKSRKKDRDNDDDKKLTEALYNSFVNLAYVIVEDGYKPKSGQRLKRRGKVKFTDSPRYLRGKFGSEDRDPDKARERMKKNIALQDAPEARKGTVASKTKKHYAKLHKKADAGDAKAKELLRRAEMSDTD